MRTAHRATLAVALVALGTLTAAPAWATEQPEPEPTRTVAPGPEVTPPIATVAPNPPTVVREVGLYVYQKLDPAAPAAWPNSGPQQFIAAQPGSEWFASFPGTLPSHVCGDGWAVQQDKVEHDGSFLWPATITYPHDNIGWPPIYAAKHADLETLVDVPECVDPEPTPEPTEPPVVEPPVEREVLAETGAADEALATVGLTGGALALLGILLAVTVPAVAAIRHRRHNRRMMHLQAIRDGDVDPFA